MFALINTFVALALRGKAASPCWRVDHYEAGHKMCSLTFVFVVCPLFFMLLWLLVLLTSLYLVYFLFGFVLVDNYVVSLLRFSVVESLAFYLGLGVCFLLSVSLPFSSTLPPNGSKKEERRRRRRRRRKDEEEKTKKKKKKKKK